MSESDDPTDGGASPPPTREPAAKRTRSKAAQRGILPIGFILNGIYEVKRFLARGGMGEVYEGCNVNADERVAIKVILPHLAADPKVQALFRKEAKTLTSLAHPALVQYRVLAREPRKDLLYIVTDFIDGEPLTNLIGRGRPTTYELVMLTRRLAEGLGAAHSHGAIHRDMSPDNVLLAGGKLNQAKIIDFGIAKSMDVGAQTVVGDGFAGKLGYVAPEQFGDFGRNIGPWTDIYSLALVTLALAGGAAPDMGTTLVEAIDRRRVGPDLGILPPVLQPLFRRMLTADPTQRPQSMGEVIAELNALDVPYEPPSPVAEAPSPDEPTADAPPAEDEGRTVIGSPQGSSWGAAPAPPATPSWDAIPVAPSQPPASAPPASTAPPTASEPAQATVFAPLGEPSAPPPASTPPTPAPAAPAPPPPPAASAPPPAPTPPLPSAPPEPAPVPEAFRVEPKVAKPPPEPKPPKAVKPPPEPKPPKPPKPAPTPKPPHGGADDEVKKKSPLPLILGGVAAVLVIGVAVAVLMPKPKPVTGGGLPEQAVVAPPTPVETVVAAALPTVDCSWLVMNRSEGQSATVIKISGAAGDPAAANRAISGAVQGAGAGGVEVDTADLLTVPASACGLLKVVQSQRSPTSTLTPGVMPQQLQFEINRGIQGCPAGLWAQSMVMVAPDPNKSFSLIAVQPSGRLHQLAMSREEFQNLARQVPDKFRDVGGGRYRVSTCQEEQGLAGMLLIEGDGPFNLGLRTGAAVRQPRDFIDRLEAQAKEKGWTMQMAWYRLANSQPDRAESEVQIAGDATDPLAAGNNMAVAAVEPPPTPVEPAAPAPPPAPATGVATADWQPCRRFVNGAWEEQGYGSASQCVQRIFNGRCDVLSGRTGDLQLRRYNGFIQSRTDARRARWENMVKAADACTG